MELSFCVITLMLKICWTSKVGGVKNAFSLRHQMRRKEVLKKSKSILGAHNSETYRARLDLPSSPIYEPSLEACVLGLPFLCFPLLQNKQNHIPYHKVIQSELYTQEQEKIFKFKSYN